MYMKAIAVLDNLRSVYNVGSIFRTANAVGIEKIYLCGTTPTPLDKKDRKRKDFAKVALGAEDTVAWEYYETAFQCIEKIKEEGFHIISLEQEDDSTNYNEIDISSKEKVAFVIGNEVDGIGEEILRNSDVVAEIPMLGSKESLNVTIAFGIAVYRILRI
jgi:23S rRNA (guanosine2251-2'-O)-methyltransferase